LILDALEIGLNLENRISAGKRRLFEDFLALQGLQGIV
jgi:hypothetical protein